MPSIFKGPVPNWLTHPSRNMNELVDLTFTNAVYYPSWRVYRQQPPSALSLGHITHVFYAFAQFVTSISVLKGIPALISAIVLDRMELFMSVASSGLEILCV